MSEVVKEAAECIELVANLSSTGEKGGEKVASGFRARARSIPSTLFTNGFTYTATLLAARGSRRLAELGFRNSCRSIVDEVVNVMRRGGADAEELSYGLYEAILIYLLRSVGAVRATNFRDLITESIGNTALDLRASQVAEWIKRFAEAYIEK
jgi:CRISPR type III-B/RAMP module-associated protein Cmr5